MAGAIAVARHLMAPASGFGVTVDGAGRSAYSVRDNGVGFEMRDVDKLLVPFQRLHRRDECEGAGIGLVIVARIIARHGGRIEAEAEAAPGLGATFRFTLEAGK